ncbi:MAG TPA: FadD3 family acyl-CoA ligase [Kofleriaceae bacterium]|nr:FadD3 family acyl-CoA ligase [Kofleriaceae bacterium]
MTIGAVVERAARDRAGDPAVVDGEVVLTNEALAARAGEVARALVGSGLGRGDAVAIWAPNAWTWIAAALGAHAIGAVLVPINTRYKGEEAAHVLARSRARVLFTVDGFLGASYPALLRAAAVPLPALETIVVAGGAASEGTIGWADFVARGARVAPADVARHAAAVSPDDVGDLMFTSGTTGRPKGVGGRHAQSLRAFGDWAELVGLRRGDRYLVVAPFFHSFGYKAGWLAALMTGAVVHPQPVFDVDRVLARIAAERITVLPGPPTLYLSLLAHPARSGADLSSLRLAVTGAASVPVELVRRMGSELGFETVLTGYGLTETTGCATLCRAGDDAETVATTSGRAMPGVEVAIVDDDGAPVATGGLGEIVIRGYNVMRGYLDDPAATAETIDAAGWLRTGDIGALDDRGNLRITDRKKDMFIVGGFNAYPAEIEATLVRHPAVAHVAVVGAPDDRLGEVGVAFVVPRPGVTVTADDLISWSRDRMANFKVPRRIILVDALPQNASGKVLKGELRARVR